MASVGRLVKESAIEELGAKLAERSNLFVTTVNRLSAPDADSLRQKLYGSQARLIMVKRTLGRRLLERLSLSEVSGLFNGAIGLVLAGEDALTTAKVIVDFVKAHEEQLAVQGGYIDGVVLDKHRVEELASLPPKPVLLAQVVATLESPIADVLFTLERLIGDLIWAADQAAEKKPAPAAPVEANAPEAAPQASPAPETSTPPPPTETKAEQPPTTQEGTPA